MILRWLPQAIADRDALLDYIANDSPNAAIEQGDLINAQTRNLADYPQIGRLGRMIGTRELVINRTPFIAVYTLDEKNKVVQIIRLLHGAQMWP